MLYIIAQCLGAICGAGIVKEIMKHPYNSLGGGANSVSEGYSKGAALGAEIIGTFVLVYTVFSATDPKRTARDSFIPVCAYLHFFFCVMKLFLLMQPRRVLYLHKRCYSYIYIGPGHQLIELCHMQTPSSTLASRVSFRNPELCIGLYEKICMQQKIKIF